MRQLIDVSLKCGDMLALPAASSERMHPARNKPLVPPRRGDPQKGTARGGEGSVEEDRIGLCMVLV